MKQSRAFRLLGLHFLSPSLLTCFLFLLFVAAVILSAIEDVQHCPAADPARVQGGHQERGGGQLRYHTRSHWG